MRVYITILLNSFKRITVYRFNFVISILMQTSGMILSVLMWIAIYKNSGAEVINDFTLEDMIRYLILSNIGMLLFSNESVLWLGNLVHSGKLTFMLVRPYSVLGEFIAMNIGGKLFYIILYFSSVLIAFIAAPSMYGILLMAYSVMVFIMYTMFIALIGAMGFWLIQVWPLRMLLNAVYMLMAGVLFPLSMLPDDLYKIIIRLPFALVGHTYSLAIQNKLPFNDLLIQMCMSSFWIVSIYLLYKRVYKRGLKRYEGVNA